jgi:hypothetical protein
MGGAKSFSTYREFTEILDNFLSDMKLYSESAKIAGNYVKQNTGATAKIMAQIFS